MLSLTATIVEYGVRDARIGVIEYGAVVGDGGVDQCCMGLEGTVRQVEIAVLEKKA